MAEKKQLRLRAYISTRTFGATKAAPAPAAPSSAAASSAAGETTSELPGQATSYYFGYHNFLTMRGRAEVELGDKFDRQKFNDFILSQGLLPPDLMQQAVDNEFIPSQK